MSNESRVSDAGSGGLFSLLRVMLFAATMAFGVLLFASVAHASPYHDSGDVRCGSPGVALHARTAGHTFVRAKNGNGELVMYFDYKTYGEPLSRTFYRSGPRELHWGVFVDSDYSGAFVNHDKTYAYCY